MVRCDDERIALDRGGGEVKCLFCASEIASRDKRRKCCCNLCAARYRASASARQRFEEKIARDGPTDCWLWAGATQEFGYGYMNFNGKRESTHRLAWWFAHGVMPNGVIRHTCDVPACVNPAHLLEGTQIDNVRDSVERGRLPKGTQKREARLTDAIVRLCRVERASGVSARELATRYGVSQACINHAVSGLKWKHVA
jgi:hypothetical protein